ncbi:MAG: hypothetical protein S0880_27240 [Actinomycetota bacterium]|nr:hypothetical protein [Actinomycetota bacterium]
MAAGPQTTPDLLAASPLPRTQRAATTLRFRRVVVDRDGLSAAADLHRRCTIVVAPNGPAADLLATLVGRAFTADDTGLHLEWEEDGGRELVAFRPRGGAHVVLDVATGEDLSDGFRGPDGGLWLPDAYGIRPHRSPAPADGSPDVAIRLASVDQGVLWAAAQRVRAAEAHLDAVCARTGADREEAANAAPVRARRGRRNRTSPLATAAAELRQATAAWHDTAGTATIEEAEALRPWVEMLASLRGAASAMAAISAGQVDVDLRGPGALGELVGAIVTDPDAVRVPAVVRFPPFPLEESVSQLALDLILEAGAARQIIVVTDDPQVAARGRLEAHGQLASVVDLT